MNSPEELFKNIPRTNEEMAKIKANIANNDLEQAVNKAHKFNEKVINARRLVRMFESDDFKHFWSTVIEEMEVLTKTSVQQIKGSPAPNQRYDPLGQLVQLNLIQGGTEMLDSIKMQKKIIEETAKLELVKVEELESKLKAIN